MQRDRFNASEVSTEYNRSGASAYRSDDEAAFIREGARTHWCRILGELCRGFGHKIDVLDVGCGTGRFFRCLRNVRRLVGLDFSQSMLDEARNPSGRDKLDIDDIELIQGNIMDADLPSGGFDLAISIGVFGDHVPMTPALLGKLASVLKDDGLLFFTIVDTDSRLHIPRGDGRRHLARRALNRIFPKLTPELRARINKILSPTYVSADELGVLLAASPFASFDTRRYRHTWGWQGVHFDCLGSKKGTARLPHLPSSQ